MRVRKAILAIFMAGGMTAMSSAGPVAELAGEAERLAEGGDPLRALEELDRAVEHVWSRMPLTIRKALLVDSASGYGIYAPREDPVYRPGEVIQIYAEPVGFAYGRNPLGGLQISFDIDLVLRDGSGEEVLAREDFISVETPVRYRNREFQLTLSLNLTGAPTGKYAASFLARDRHSDKSAPIELTFEIAE